MRVRGSEKVHRSSEDSRELTVVHEESVVGTRGDDSDLDAVLGIPSGETVKDAAVRLSV